jgi:hypothetical protein
MRSEFIGHCTEFPGLAEAANEGQYLIPRMTRDEVRLAITGPVAVGGGEIAPVWSRGCSTMSATTPISFRFFNMR